ncbi:epoxide hydrolase family protein [Streptomyces sp. 4N124]|uniref:epoxide hydrolase family protein n=1 Tax=Streptomyces sp. 4N124 TaxID=3457420 RepID=UPI003FD0FA69
MSDNGNGRSLERYSINVPQDVLDDLRTRLRATRFDADLDNETGYYGLSTEYIRPLVEYWADGFDWRAQEQRMNSHNQHRVEIDGTPVHFIYVRGKGSNRLPVLLHHGWPWTPDFNSKLIGPLTDPAAYGGDPADAFDLVVPSLPGFAWSTPVGRGDLNYWKIADIMHKLMTEVLGFEKYGAIGSDYGALVTSQLGHKYADHVVGVHYGGELVPGFFQSDKYWDVTEGFKIPEEATERFREDWLYFEATRAGHVATHMLETQVVTHALNDSPVGMLAWLLKRWKEWSDRWGDFDEVFPRDFILTQATTYWVTQSIGSSIRMYKNSLRYPWKPEHDRQPQIEPPAGLTYLLGDAYPPDVRTAEERIAAFENGPTRAWLNPINIKVHEKGGHFVAWENAEAFTGDIRETFRKVR